MWILKVKNVSLPSVYVISCQMKKNKIFFSIFGKRKSLFFLLLLLNTSSEKSDVKTPHFGDFFFGVDGWVEGRRGVEDIYLNPDE